ncbi:MAG TPA: DDE-type integrase/transposase/recombinase [Rhodopila sp.]|jgi:hypothetical protein|nr:DDE-type integrase/transposase/recombinase [Rhodopila sp.]
MFLGPLIPAVLGPALVASAAPGDTALPTKAGLADSAADLDRDGIDLASSLTVSRVALPAARRNPVQQRVRARNGVAQTKGLQAGPLPNPQGAGANLPLVAGFGTTQAWNPSPCEAIRSLITLSRSRAAAGSSAHIFWRSSSPPPARNVGSGRAVDQEGFVLDVRVQSRCDLKAAKRLFGKRLKKQGRAPLVLITDKLEVGAIARREIMPGVQHRQQKRLNSRAENSHQPIRRRERTIKQFRSPQRTHWLLSTHDRIANVFASHSSRDTAARFRSARGSAFMLWAKVVDVAMAT